MEHTDVLDANVETPELAYDYTRVPEEDREEIREKARGIKGRLQRTARDIFEIGAMLTEAKARLPHGEWGNWLEQEFEMSDRMARRFMNSADRLLNKTDTLSVLPLSALYLLAAPSTPDAVVETVAGQAEAGEKVTVKDIKQAIAAHYAPVHDLESAIYRWLRTYRPEHQDDPATLLQAVAGARTMTTRPGDQWTTWQRLADHLRQEEIQYRRPDILQAMDNVSDRLRRYIEPGTPTPANGHSFAPWREQGWQIRLAGGRYAAYHEDGRETNLCSSIAEIVEELQGMVEPEPEPDTWDAGAVGLDRDWSGEEIEEYVEAMEPVGEAQPVQPEPDSREQVTLEQAVWSALRKGNASPAAMLEALDGRLHVRDWDDALALMDEDRRESVKLLLSLAIGSVRRQLLAAIGNRAIVTPPDARPARVEVEPVHVMAGNLMDGVVKRAEARQMPEERESGRDYEFRTELESLWEPAEATPPRVRDVLRITIDFCDELGAGALSDMEIFEYAGMVRFICDRCLSGQKIVEVNDA